MIYNYQMKRIAVIIIVCIILGLAGFSVYRGNKTTAARSIETASVTRGTFVRDIKSSGKTKSDTSVELKFQGSGKLLWVNVKEGDMVQAYQAIAGLDAREVQKNLEKSLRDYSAQRNDFEHMTRVTYDNIFDPTKAPNDTIRRILEKNQWDLDKAVLDVELRHLALEYATLVTPIAGIVTHVDTPVAGVNVTPATAMFAISDPSSLVFEANVDEIDVGRLVIGQPATIALDAFADTTFSGKISYISFVSETSGGGATVFPVKITFDQPQNLRIGLNGDVSIEVAKEEQVLTVPIEAVREDDEGKYVFRKTGESFERVAVTVGNQNEDIIVIKSGLSDGELVAVKGFSNLPK